MRKGAGDVGGGVRKVAEPEVGLAGNDVICGRRVAVGGAVSVAESGCGWCRNWVGAGIGWVRGLRVRVGIKVK